MKMEFKTISKKAKSLLSREEGYEVELKQSEVGLETEDLVAFANSKNGGSILVGIKEIKDKFGKQKAKIVGCKGTDKEKMSIKQKALNCIHSIDVEIFKENTDENLFYRIEIPSGENKPYCTSKGIYKIRDDGHNKVIDPDKLLLMFINLESDKFLKKFKEATKEIENSLSDISRDINESLNHLSDIVPQLSDLEVYSYLTEDILHYAEKTQDYVENMAADLNQNERRILTLMEHFNIEDPYLTDLKESAMQFMKWDAERVENIFSKAYLEKIKSTFPNLDFKLLNACQQAIRDEIDRKD